MPKGAENRPERYRYTQNRELSWLRFNQRVLEEAADESNPLLERLKFVAIFSSNLDEFFMVRVGSLFDLAAVSPEAVDNKTGMTPIQQLANISSPDAHSLLITPYDNSVLKGVEKAILASDVGITPQNDGKAIRLTFPPLTEERRKELTKQVAKYAEEAKVAIRNVRRDAMDDFKAQKKKSEMTEDDYKVAEKDIQNLTDKIVKEVEAECEKKEKELLEI